MTMGRQIPSASRAGAGWLLAACLSVITPGDLTAADQETVWPSPNEYGLTRGKVPVSDHWGNPFRKLFSGPKSSVDCRTTSCSSNHLRGDWHGHRWTDYAFSGDCYNETWRTATWHQGTTRAAYHQKLREARLAAEREECWSGRPDQPPGFQHDASGTMMSNFLRKQSHCGPTPCCKSLFGKHAPLYQPYAYSVRHDPVETWNSVPGVNPAP